MTTEQQNEIVTLPDLPPSRGIMERPFTGAEVKAQVNMIQEVIEAVFKEGHHFGKIPGTGDKNTLLKPGAEKLCLTFRIAPKLTIEDLSTDDEIRYQVLSEAWHIISGDYLGSGVGEASSNEEKYKWRKAKVKQEWEATPEDRRRKNWQKKYQSREFHEVLQVRTNPPDIANTVLKMAKKRAMVDMTLSVTAASDVFAQDYDDMTPEMRKNLGQEEGIQDPKRKEEGAEEEKKKTTTAKGKTKATAKKKTTTAKKKEAEPEAEAGDAPPTPPGDPSPPDAFEKATAARKETAAEEADPEELPLGGKMVDDDEDCFKALIESVKEDKRGVNRDSGKSWVRYAVELSTGDNLTTFNERLMNEAVRACEEGLLCKVFYEENQWGFNLKGLEVIE